MIDGLHWDRDIVAAEFGMHSGTRCAFKYHKPIFVGEFGIWYAGYPEAIQYRAAALDDQLGVFDSAAVNWAVWTWKDIVDIAALLVADRQAQRPRYVTPGVEYRYR